jgi:hypothetical protein
VTGGGIHEEVEGGHHGRPNLASGTEFFSKLNGKRSFLKSFDSDLASVEVSIEVCSFLSRSCSLCKSCREACKEGW